MEVSVIMNKKQIPDFSALAEKWPSLFVSREQVGNFSGGAISPKTLANYDSDGRGVKNRIRLNGKIIYPVSDLIKFLQARSVKLD
jgi:hypothetical protein